MGEIYRATDTALGRAVAVKVLADRYAWDEEVRRRFTREALAAARLSGEPNIVTIFDVGESNGRPFIVMEYLPGGSLEDVVRGTARAAPGAGARRGSSMRPRRWTRRTRTASSTATSSPANLLVDGRRQRPRRRLRDRERGRACESLTQPGTVLGTAGYLAPEQAQGETRGAGSRPVRARAWSRSSC